MRICLPTLLAFVVVTNVALAQPAENAAIAKELEGDEKRTTPTSHAAIKAEITQLKRRLAESYLDRGLRLCDEGEAARGSLWMARALTVLSHKADGQSMQSRERNSVPDPAHAIRANLGAWQLSISRLRLVLPHRAPVTHLAFSPDGKTVLTSSFGKIAWLWDVTTGKPIGAPLEHKGIVYALAYSPDGKTVLTGSGDKTARLWDARAGKPIGATFRHQDSVCAVAFSPDGKRVLTGSRDNASARHFLLSPKFRSN
jgi:WD40 repeat protein